MRKYALIFCLIAGVLGIPLQGQVVITPLLQNQTFFQIDQLFQVSVLNPRAIVEEGYLEITVEDQHYANVLSLKSAPIRIGAGQRVSANQINWPFNIVLGSSEKSSTLGQMGKFPFGEYVVCYQFYTLSTNQPNGVYCQELTIEVLGKPELRSPYDEEQVSTTFPVLSWSPPLPLDVPDVWYSLKLTRLGRAQSAAEALQLNAPLLEVNRITQTFLPYPSDAPRLKEEETYVWQVTAFSGQWEIAPTDIWRFSLSTQTTAQVPIPTESYRFVKHQLDGRYYLAKKTLHFAFDNRQCEGTLNYQILPAERGNQPLPKTALIRLTPGINKIDLEGRQIRGLENDKKYILKITNQLGERYYFPFHYHSS